MADINVDVNETEIFHLYSEVLDTLLKDHTTGESIRAATHHKRYCTTTEELCSEIRFE